MTDLHKIDASESANSSHSKKRLRLLAGIASLLLLLGNSGKAQEPNRRWENLQTLRTGEKIQVVDQHLKSTKGTLIGISAMGITLETEGGDITVPRSEVYRVTTQKGGRGRLHHAVIGGAIAAGVGAAAGARDQGNPDWWSGPKGAAIGAAILAPLGFGIGAAIPPSHPTIYRGERRKGQDAP